MPPASMRSSALSSSTSGRGKRCNSIRFGPASTIALTSLIACSSLLPGFAASLPGSVCAGVAVRAAVAEDTRIDRARVTVRRYIEAAEKGWSSAGPSRAASV